MTSAADVAAAATQLNGAGIVGAVLAGIVLVAVAARPLLSKLNLGTRMDGAQIDAIDRLGKLLNEEREARKIAEERADRFAQERNEAIQKVGRLEGEIHALRADVQRQAAVIESLRADMERRHAPPTA